MKTRVGSVSKYATKSGARLWRYRFDADPVDGKRRVVSQAGFSTRGEAVKACADAISAYETSNALPAPPAPSKETLAYWLRVWLRDYAPQKVSPKTLESYHGFARYILDAKVGEPARLAITPLAEVDHVIIESTLYELLRTPTQRTEHLSGSTVHQVAKLLSATLNKAFRLGKINVNPLLRVELPKVEPHEAGSLTPEQMNALRDACRGDWTFTFVEIALATGCRRGELLALTWPDVDYLTSTLMVSKSLEETFAGLRIKRPKSNRVRKFRIGQSAIASLRFLQDQQQEHRRLCGADYKDQNLIFCQVDGSYLWPHLVSQTITRRLRKAGIKDASLHTTRHTHASTLLSNGVPLPAVSARLGHSNVAITARIYSHALPEDDVRAADAWENVTARQKKPSVTSCDNAPSPKEAETTVTQ